MSGLDVDKEHILEMACLVTDADLNIIAETEDLVIHQPDSVLDNMGEWCTKHHAESGLTEAVRNSKISLSDAEKEMLDFIREHTTGKAPLAGNSIHMDKLFLAKYMPKFTDYLHYRMIDVSTIKELSRRWYTKEFSNAPKKQLSHRALDDIKESIEELKYYRMNVFKPVVDSDEVSSGEETGESSSEEKKSKIA
ncbi:oligoribonuclease, mitochondrial-like isoform X2 [Ruditapes philippinarum]|uniref:oligoribonuclease, mitochondrial-like isoform X2 n=2 Tax=Ruditapes philippinarum TaxID=129788 RepID=UPI00295ACB89|nr:oligoribonuclease, mitochondrial-like isoform X2 [Ruditapes philippinarum]